MVLGYGHGESQEQKTVGLQQQGNPRSLSDPDSSEEGESTDIDSPTPGLPRGLDGAIPNFMPNSNQNLNNNSGYSGPISSVQFEPQQSVRTQRINDELAMSSSDA